MLGLGASLAKGGASLLTYVKSNLKLYLDFKSNKSDTLKFPCDGSTSFDGDNDYIDFGNSSSLQITGKTITVSAWIKADVLNDWSVIIGNASGGNWEDGWALYWSSNLLKFSINHYSTNLASTAYTSTGVWSHVAGTYDGTTMKIYLDGVLGTTTDTYSSAIGNSTSTIMGKKIDETNYWEGSIANVGIWDRVLSIEEINSVMRKNYSQLGSVEKTSLVSWWALDSQTQEGSELITNGGASGTTDFVDTDDNGLADNFGLIYGNEAFSIVTGNGFTGNAQKMGSSGTGWRGIQTSGSVFTDNITYQWSLKYRSNVSVTLLNGSSDGIGSGLSSSSEVISVSGTHKANGGGSFRFRISDGNSVDSYIEFDEVSLKELKMKDEHGSNHGSNVDATTTTSVYGGNAPVLPRAVDVAREGEAEAIGDGSALLDGTDDYIQVDNITLPNLEPYTITAWIKTTDVDQTQAIVLWGDQTAYERRALIIYNGGGGSDWTLVASTNGDNPQGATTVTEGEWTHASITVTPSTKAYKIYMNGILDGSGTFSNSLVAFSNSTLLIGKSYYGEFFEGNIAGVGIWYGELTQAQIQSVMESTSYAKIPADVKSTLGSELSPDFDFSKQSTLAHSSTGTHWITSNANMSISGGKAVKVGGGSAQLQSTSTTLLTQNKLYKATITIDSTDGGDATGTIIFSESGGSGTFPNVVGTHSVYGVSKHGSVRRLYLEMGYHTDATISQFSVKEVTNDLVGYWALDADSSNSTSGKALSFDGTNDYVEISDSDILDQGTNDFTVSFWHKSDAQHDQPFVNKKATFSDNTAGWTIYMENGANQMRCRIGGGSSNVAVSAGSVAVNDEKWHLTTMVRSGDNLYLYTDGSQEGSTTGVNSLNVDNSDPLYIARSASLYPACEIAQVAIYDTALTTAQILTQFKNGSNADWSSDANLVGYWKLNNASTVTDLSSNSNNGTVNGATLIDNASVYDSTDNNNNGDLY